MRKKRVNAVKVLKVINNNVVSAFNDENREVVVMGKGIGFQKKPGDTIDDALIEKVFRLSDASTGQFEELIKDIPLEQVRLAGNIISHAKKYMDKKLSRNIYITLTDHLSNAITRAKEGVRIENAVLWEIKRFYRQEYRFGMDALQMVKETLGVELPEDEAGFLALHIVNAEMGSSMNTATKAPDMIKDMLNIVAYTLKQELDPDSIEYERFVTHLKFLLERIARNRESNRGNPDLNAMIQKGFPESYRCAIRVQTYIQARLDYTVSDDELTYLTTHIESFRMHRH
jgi:beta-glucoside operon transcriptional antiterminator